MEKQVSEASTFIVPDAGRRDIAQETSALGSSPTQEYRLAGEHIAACGVDAPGEDLLVNGTTAPSVHVAEQSRVTTGRRARGTGSRKKSKRKKSHAHEMWPVQTGIESLPLGTNFTVQRTKLLLDIATHAAACGCVVICAPWAFGKTALLLQYVEMVRSDPKRGGACLIDAAGINVDEFIVQLAEARRELGGETRPLVAIDNMPAYDRRAMEQAVRDIQRLRNHGCEVVLTCTPSNRTLLRLCGDADKIFAQSLLVGPRDYADWADVFSLSASLDVYRLTQGVPSLVAALFDADPHGKQSTETLDACIFELYRSVLGELAREDEQLCCVGLAMLLLGEGSITSIERMGIAVPREYVTCLQHDYPVFGVNRETHNFSCLGERDGSQQRLCELAMQTQGDLAMQAVESLMSCDRVDRAAWIVGQLMDEEAAAAAVAQYPTEFTFAGHADLVISVCGSTHASPALQQRLPLALASYVASLAIGDVRRVRRAIRELSLHAHQVEGVLSPVSWRRAEALGAMWGAREGLMLPQVFARAPGKDDPMQKLIQLHMVCLEHILEHRDVPEEARLGSYDVAQGPFDVPRMVIVADVVLSDALMYGDVRRERIAALDQMVSALTERHLTPVATYMRMVADAARLLTGLPIEDERSFVDAGTLAVRMAQTGLQLLSMLFEGWQALVTGQVVNAQFRGQQVVKLAGTTHPFLASWAGLLDHTAHVCNTSRMSLRQEAELLDIGAQLDSALGLWGMLFTLSAAQCDAQVSAWYSLNRARLLDAQVGALVRLALRALGDRADAIRRIMPADALGPNGIESSAASALVLVTDERALSPVDEDQVVINLFGGFRAERGGHVMVNEQWRRKKTTAMVARLVLARGAFVERSDLTLEFWPMQSYDRARRNLYSSLSTLRQAIGQRKGGPNHLLVQGSGVAINLEYVSSDVFVFDQLVRQVLLNHSGLSAAQTIELCLKVEQVYRGPLYLPEHDNRAFFLHERHVLSSRFADCMIRGVEVALGENDLTSAVWMAEAALAQEPVREDVIRSAMRVYARDGRRRELVELYESHLQFLADETHGLPEPETQALYNELVREMRSKGMM